MGAREQLNTLYITSGLVTAAVVGVAFDSWTAFVVVAVVTVCLMLSDSRIRTSPIHQVKTLSRWKSRRPHR